MFAHRIDAWMFCFKSVSVSVSLAWEQGHDQAQADTSPQALPDQQRSGPCPSCVISWFPNSTSLICLFEPWRRQGGASLASPGQSSRIRVGLPTRVKPQRMSHSPALVLASHLRGISHCHNSISKQIYRRSQLLLHWTSHRWDRDSTSLLGTTLLHLQGQTLTLPPSSKLN